MKHEQFLYELRSTTMDPCSITKGDYEKARATWLCTGCAQPKPGVGALDVHLQGIPTDVPLNFVYGVSLGIVRRDFLAVLGTDPVARDLKLGKVFDPQNQQIPEFATFRGRVRIVLRGDTRSSYRRCNVCGRHLYSPMGTPYILSCSLKGEATIHETQLNDLLVDAEIVERVRGKKWKGLAILKVAVADAQKDGKPFFCTENEPEPN